MFIAIHQDVIRNVSHLLRHPLVRLFLAGCVSVSLMPVLRGQAARPAIITAPESPLAPTTLSWRDGVVQYSDIVNCVSIIQGQPHSEKGIATYASQRMNVDGGAAEPTAGQVYYLRVWMPSGDVPNANTWPMPIGKFVTIAFPVISSASIANSPAVNSDVQTFRTLSNGSVVIGTGTPASCTDTALRTLINDIQTRQISFNCGPAPITITLSTATSPRNYTVMSRTLAIDGGNNVVLMGVPNAPHFIVGPSGTLDLSNITLMNGRGGGCGGSIFANGPITVTNARFIGKVSSNTASGAVAHGGAIGMSPHNTFGRLFVEDSVFTGNSAANGGAIASRLQFVQVAASTFSRNTTPGFGGAVYGPAFLSNASIISNTSKGICVIDEFERLCLVAGGGLHGVSRVTNTLLTGNAPANCTKQRDRNCATRCDRHPHRRRFTR